MLKTLYQDWRDEKLLKAFTCGDQSAFEQLYSRYSSQLVSHLYQLTGDRLKAEEIAQDSWLTVISHARQYDPSLRFTTWLFTIARRKQIDVWRKQSTHRRLLGRPLVDALEQLSDDGINDAINAVQLQELIDRVRKLSDVQLETLLLKIAGFSQKEIASITNAEPEAVKSRLRYASRSIRAAWPV